MGIFDFLQSIGALGQMVKNVIQIYKKLQQEPRLFLLPILLVFPQIFIR